MDDLIELIENYSKEAGIAPATVCDLAVGNQRLYRRLLDGQECRRDTERRLREFIDGNPAATRRGRRSVAATTEESAAGIAAE